MSENTDARDTKELGTTLYDRAREVREIAELMRQAFTLVMDADFSLRSGIVAGESRVFADELESVALTLNPNAAADSMERNGEPLELAKTDGDFLTGQFQDLAGDDCEISWRAEVGLKPMLLLGCVGDEMILARQQVAALLPHLRRYAETGRL